MKASHDKPSKKHDTESTARTAHSGKQEAAPRTQDTAKGSEPKTKAASGGSAGKAKH